MSTTRHRSPASPTGMDWIPYWTKVAEIAWAAPQVIAYRMFRLMSGGWPPDARDRREYRRMGQEKAEAFSQAWMAAAMAWPLTGVAVLEKSLAPVHRTVTANRRRLSR